MEEKHKGLYIKPYINKVILSIAINEGRERSWKLFRDILKSDKDTRINIDLRKSSKNNIPLSLEAKCCKTILEVRRVKDFPLEDRWCKCHKTKMIEWIINK